jgi:hypothetical protein
VGDLDHSGIGAARRADVPITDALWKLIDDAIKSPTDATKSRTTEPHALSRLNDVAIMAAQAKLDVIGNPVRVEELVGLMYVIEFPSGYKKTIVPFRLRTGRDNVFDTQLTYPTNSLDLVPLRRKAY